MRNCTPLIAFLIILFFSERLYSQSTARYSVSFNSSWNDADHGPLPANAHWSDLVGVTHNSSVIFWEAGQMASPGIEDVAELGSNGNFSNEVNAAISANNADQWLQAAFNPFAAISTATLTDITVSSDYPLLTLASMIAPSPDWFVGVSSFSLIDTSGNWKNSVVLDMFVYDAGTEEGSSYSTSNPASMPHGNITSLVNITPFNDQPVGTLTITLEEVLSVEESDLSSGLLISPNPANRMIRIFNKSNIDLERISIYNSLGQQVRQLKPKDNREIKIERNDLASGIYLVNIKGADGHSTVKRLILI